MFLTCSEIEVNFHQKAFIVIAVVIVIDDDDNDVLGNEPRVPPAITLPPSCILGYFAVV